MERTMSTTTLGPAGGAVPGPCVAVGDDGSRHSDAPVRYAASEASARRLPLLVLRLSVPAVDADRSVTAQLRDERVAVREASEALDARVAAIRAAHPGTEVVQGLVVEGTGRLDDVLEDCSLLVLGSRSRRGPTVFRFGSPSQQLLHASSCPVVVVPEDEVSAGQGTGGVVAGIDGGRLTQPVLRAAAQEASLRGSALTVLHVYRTPEGGVPETVRATAEQLCADQVRLAGLTQEDVAPRSLSCRLVDDDADRALVRESAGAQLLVMGTRGTLALGNLTRGSISRAVLAAAVCPVMFVRRPVHARGTGEEASATASR
ncbi:MAG: universal stress protein [Actinomycetes bacterium]